jgi:cell division protein FtsB
MESLDTRVKTLTDENEQLKKENSKLLTRIHTLEMEVCFSLINFTNRIIFSYFIE